MGALLKLPIQLNLRKSASTSGLDHLIQITRPAHGQNRQSVRLGNVVQVVGSDEAASPWHVLHDDSGIARNMLAQIGATSRALMSVVAPGPLETRNWMVFPS